jgi:hypothetical protein
LRFDGFFHSRIDSPSPPDQTYGWILSLRRRRRVNWHPVKQANSRMLDSPHPQKRT